LASKETTASFVIRSVLENELYTKNYCFSGFKVYAKSNVQFSHMNACEDEKEELPPFDRQMKNSCCIISWHQAYVQPLMQRIENVQKKRKGFVPMIVAA